MTSALTRLVSRQLSVSFEQWKFETEQTRRVQIAVRRAMSFEGGFQLLRALSRWARTPPKLALVTTAAGRLRSQPLMSAFGQWRRRGEAATVARRSLAHLCYRGLSTGFCAWLEFLTLLGKAQRAFFGLRAGGLRKGFNGWAGRTQQRLEALQLMERGIGGIRARPMLAAFNSWASLIHGPPDPMVSALAHLQHRELSSALRMWAVQKDELLTMKGALTRLFLRQLSQCMQTWQARTEEARKRRQQMSTALSVVQGGVGKAFRQWTHVAGQLSRRCAAVERWVHRQTCRAFESWRALYEEKLLMARARGAVLRAPLRRAIAAWKAHRPPSLRLAPRRPQQRGDFVCSAYAHMPRASLAPRR